MSKCRGSRVRVQVKVAVVGKCQKDKINNKTIFFHFLTKTSQQHKGRILVIVSFFVYFRHVSSLTETSSGNEYNY